MWVMSYTCSRSRPDASTAVFVGHCVTREHPILRVRKWNDLERQRKPALDRAGPLRTSVLNWYAPLSPAEVAELAAGGLTEPITTDETATIAD